MGGCVRWGCGIAALALSLFFIAATGIYAEYALPICLLIALVGFASGALFHLDRHARKYFYRPPIPEIRVQEIFLRVADDYSFQQVADLHASDALLRDFRAILETASICYSFPIPGGYAHLVPERGIVLGLSHLHLRSAAAAHELFHLVRHLNGEMPFPPEPPCLKTVIKEESKVWFLTVWYAPLGGSLELIAHFAVLGAAVCFVLYWSYCFC